MSRPRVGVRRRSAGAAVLASALALGIGACGDGDSTTTAAADAGCPEVEAPAPKELGLPGPKADAPTATGVEFATSCGDFTVTFDERAPKTAASMQYLAEEGAYDDTVFHRVISGRLVQGGDPLGTDEELAGTGGPGYFVDERPPGNLAYTQGTVAMAKTAAEPIGRSGSQFFIVVAADEGLTPDYALAGEVTEGMDVVTRISELGVEGADGPPSTPVVIESATPVGE